MALDRFSIQVSHSKTNQFGQIELIIHFTPCEDIRICPLSFLLLHLNKSCLPISNFLFDHVKQGQIHCVTHTAFVDRLKLGLKCIGLDPVLLPC